MLTVGTKAPAFSLPDAAGQTHTLAQYKGRWILLYFYPKDDTPGCTTEACSVRDHFSDFQEHGVIVLGVSTDSVKSHEKFAAKYDLPFTLLADTEKQVVQAYGAWGKKKFMGREYDGILRISYLIDPTGAIAKVYPAVKPSEHVAEVLADLKALQV